MNNPIVPLIPIQERDGITAVSLRDLHAFLEVSRDFTNWARQMFDYGFTEDQDYAEVFANSGENPSVGRPSRNWAISLDMAKELSMIQRTEKGKQARQYFIEVEKRKSVAPSGQDLLALAVIEAQRVLETQSQQIAELTPKADAWHDLCSSAGSLSFRDAAKVISEEGGVTIGGNRLIETLMDWGWCFRPPATPEEIAKGKTRSVRAMQTQIDRGTLTEKAKTYTDQVTGEKKLSNNPQTRVTGKGLDRIRTRLLSVAVTRG